MPTKTRPLILAHRGFHQNGFPENSIAAIQAANDVADGVEFDVRETQDGVLVLHHNPAAFGRLIARTDYRTLQEEFKRHNVPISRLEAALVAIAPGKFVLAEVKVGGIAKKVAGLCRPRFGQRFRVGSFQYSDIADVPKELRWLIVVHALQAWRYRSKVRGVDFRLGGWWIRRWGLESSAWTVNDVTQAKRLAQNGVQFITTDDPIAIKESLN